MPFPEQPFGFVAGRWVLSLGDTPADEDRAPDYVPVPKGKVTFRPVLSHRVLPDTAPGAWAGVINRDVEGVLGDRGQLVDAGQHDYLALALGRYRVSFEFEGASWPSFEIDVTEEHTVDAPLWLPTLSPLPTGPGVVQVVNEATRVAAEEAAARAEAAALSAWEAVDTPGRVGPQGPKGDPGEVTTAALTAALAGKVTGITGPGRPDIPSTTDLTAAELTALPVGARYISTTGPQGAWEWQKRGTTWVVTSGDTGRISIAGMLNTGWVPANANAAWIRKTPHSLELQLGPIDTTASTSSVAINGGLPAWAQFHPQDTTWRIRSGSLVLTRTGSAYAGTYVTGPTEKEATVSMITQLFTPLNPNLWPVTLDPLTKG